MLCNPTEKMPITEWPQIGVAAMPATATATATTAGKLPDKSSQDQQQQLPLKCPRCDSSNTKFCYYNNYSLSQPRHFCKACKRYWTRGGTLRNVPVGGGCRKNKRVKRPAAAADASSASSFPSIQSAEAAPPLYRAEPPPAFPFPSFRSLEVPISSSGFDLPHLGSLFMNYPAASGESELQPGFSMISQSPLLPDFSLLGSSASSIMASHQKLGLALKETHPSNDFQVFFPMGGLHQGAAGLKGVKLEEEESGLMGNKMGGWQIPENSLENLGGSESSYWGSAGVASWPDGYGSSITPLI